MKEHKKLYKKGKLWLTATIVAAAFGLAASAGQADAATSPAPAATTEQVAPVTGNSNQNGTVNQSAEKPASAEPAQINPHDQGNYAYLDQGKVNADGTLTVSGWHATNASKDRQYHYIIAFDPTHKTEITRQNISDQEVNRPDVAQAHPVYGADHSGFTTSFDLSDKLANLDRVQIVSRYTNDPAGNGNAVDYWFAPITIDRQNHAWLESTKVVDNQLRVNGWHATNLAADKSHHWVILFDRTTNSEIARQEVDNTTRSDVAKAFPGVYKAGQSGFSANFSMKGINLDHQLQVISRYSASADGNSNYVDYWFSPLTSGGQVNQGWMDSINLSDGQHLSFAGWHASNLAQLETNRFEILYDLTANSQVAAVKTAQVARPDVAKAVPNIAGAGQSGFMGQFDLAKLNLQPGHRYTLVSRYSTSSEGNGGNGQYSDFWSVPFALDQRAFWLEGLKMTKDGLQVNGWLVNDQSLTKGHPYLILLNNGKEIGRTQLSLTNRPDVAKAYSQVYNSGHSGFSTLIKLDPALASGNLQLILRFSDDPAGNGNYDDQYSQPYNSNAGFFDKVQVSADGIYVSGWHASNQAVGKPYQWLIFVDENGHELYRQEVTDKNRARPDVAKAEPAIYNSGNSGYQLGFRLPDQLNHHMVRIIHRITDDKSGNGNAVDNWSGLISINSMRTPIDYRLPSEYKPYPNLSQLNNFWIHVRIGQNRVYLMNNNDVVYTMYCTAGYYQNGVSTTPLGTYYIQAERGNSFYNASLGEGANYWTSFLQHGVYLFHTVPTDAWGNYKPYEASQLGINQGSHGCIRLSIPDAYWIMHSVPTGTRVVIDN